VQLFRYLTLTLLALAVTLHGCSSTSTGPLSGGGGGSPPEFTFTDERTDDGAGDTGTPDAPVSSDVGAADDDVAVSPQGDTLPTDRLGGGEDTSGPTAGALEGTDAPSDDDDDGLANTEDNCPGDSNPDQGDVDGDQIGDACDPDIDGDDVDNGLDNCPLEANTAQEDSDQDDVGDLCDPDRDGDGVGNDDDNCPDFVNAGQEDADGDEVGDACDSDADGDGTLDDLDNCPGLSNPDQADKDGDTVGDACEPDSDDDGTPDDFDNCVMTPNDDQADGDLDGIGDACEPDIDSDGAPDDTDNCATTPNSDQADKDGDGIGDLCEPDSDADGVPDDSDNCPDTPNTKQVDSDGDGVGNACESDSDMDGIPDDGDLFPEDPDLPGAADTAFIYPHTSSKLFALNANTINLVEVGSFGWPSDGGNHQMTDLALDAYGTIFGVSFTHLYTCHPETVACTSLGVLPGSYNGLTMLPAGTLDPNLDVLVAISSPGQWYRLDVNDGVVTATNLGSYGPGYSSSGDAYAIVGAGTFAAVNASGSTADVLVALVPETGQVAYEVSAIGNYSNVWGLAGWLGRAYAFDSSGDVLRIDLTTGAVTIALETNHSWWGAGVATQAP
jgi:hypothetical protein